MHVVRYLMVQAGVSGTCGIISQMKANCYSIQENRNNYIVVS